MVKDHSDSERGNLLPPYMGYSFQLEATALLYAPTHREDTNTMVFVTPVIEHWLEQKTAKWVHHKGLIQQPITP